MSKETEPIRSRRQLREQSARVNGTPGTPAVPTGVAPVSGAPAAAAGQTPALQETPAVASAPAQATPAAAETAPPRERQSQTRARDRAALRAYKELVDPPGLSPLPSRKTLRQAQLDAERAPITAVNPVVSVTAVPTNTSPSTAPQPETPLQESSLPESTLPESPPSEAAVGRPVPAPAAAETAAPARSAAPAAAAVRRNRAGRRAAAISTPGLQGAVTSGPAAAGPEQGQPSATVETTVETGRTVPAQTPAQPAKPPAGAAGAAEEAQSLAPQPAAAPVADAAPAAKAPSDAVGADGAAGTIPAPDAVSHGTRPPMPGLVPGGSYYPITAGPPTTEQLRVLAAKRAETERAAVLAQRAQTREKLAQESAKNRRPAADPTATNNLAMVTPLEFMEVPGLERPVLRPPATTHVPIVTRATPVQNPGRPARPAAAEAALPPTVPNVSAERFDAALAARAVHRPGPGNRPLTGGRSGTLKRAEAMAAVAHGTPPARPATPKARAVPETVPVLRSQMPPMPADYAHGLEPLDAMTAGLGRTRRNILIQWGSIILGGAALVAGAVMFFTALAR